MIVLMGWGGVGWGERSLSRCNSSLLHTIAIYRLSKAFIASLMLAVVLNHDLKFRKVERADCDLKQPCVISLICPNKEPMTF